MASRNLDRRPERVMECVLADGSLGLQGRAVQKGRRRADRLGPRVGCECRMEVGIDCLRPEATNTIDRPRREEGAALRQQLLAKPT